MRKIHERLENVWQELLDSSTRGRTFYLTTGGRIVWGEDAEGDKSKFEMIGTYTRAVHLCQFREDVLEAWEALLRRNHG